MTRGMQVQPISELNVNPQDQLAQMCHRRFAGDSNCLWRKCKTLGIIKIHSKQVSVKQEPNINATLCKLRETGMQVLTPL
jgi:hypothetical protein